MDLRARSAEPSAAAGAWVWSCSVIRAMKGAWKARACVVLLGMVVPYSVKGFGDDGVQVKAPVSDFLDEVCREN